MAKISRTLQYLGSIAYSRVSYPVFQQFKTLTDERNSDKIEELLHTSTYRKLRYDQLPKLTITELEAYYKDKFYSFSLNFAFLERLLNQQKQHFSNQAFFPTPAFLFPNLSPLDINFLPSVMLTGEADLFRFDNNYSAYGYLTRENIIRICSFFKKSKLNSKYHFLNALSQFTAQDYHETGVLNQSPFILKYNLIEGKVEKNEDIETDIWTFDDDEWHIFLELQRGFDEFFDSLKHLVHFFDECLKYKEEQVIIRYFFD